MTTIAAISTGLAPGGIGIVRISGEDAVKIADNVFESFSGKLISQLAGYTALYGRAKDKDTYLDTAVALCFRGPKSYTGEDVVEISCHGGLYVCKRVLRAVFDAGAVPAQAGEFTKRAFLNGKMDLTGAESVMSIISAHGEDAEKIALRNIEGGLFRKIKGISDKLVYDMALLSAWVDYPYDEIPDLSEEKLAADIKYAEEETEKLIINYDRGKAIIEGVNTVIAGSPNVGKSTLMNFLSGEDKSIVTDIAGTTRDVVEDTIVVGDVLLHLSDTAGVHETDDPVESIGVDRAFDRMKKAALVLAVFDASRNLDESDRKLIEVCKGKRAIAIINKTDLVKNQLRAEIEKEFDDFVYISAKTGEGTKELEKKIREVLTATQFDSSAETLMNERQLLCCKNAKQALTEAREALESGLTLDAVNVCLDSAVESLLVMTGEKATETVVNEIFSHFCVGK